MLYEENKYKILGAKPGMVKRAFSRPKYFRVRSGGIYRAETGSVPYSTGGKKKKRGEREGKGTLVIYILDPQCSKFFGVRPHQFAHMLILSSS